MDERPEPALLELVPARRSVREGYRDEAVATGFARANRRRWALGAVLEAPSPGDCTWWRIERLSSFAAGRLGSGGGPRCTSRFTCRELGLLVDGRRVCIRARQCSGLRSSSRTLRPLAAAATDSDRAPDPQPCLALLARSAPHPFRRTTHRTPGSLVQMRQQHLIPGAQLSMRKCHRDSNDGPGEQLTRPRNSLQILTLARLERPRSTVRVNADPVKILDDPIVQLHQIPAVEPSMVDESGSSRGLAGRSNPCNSSECRVCHHSSPNRSVTRAS